MSRSKTVDPLSNAELVRRARSGEESAWDDLVRHHQESVFRLAYLLLGDPDEAEDVAQETFIRTLRHLDRFDESLPLRPWLLRIASNLSLNRNRAVGRYWNALQRLGRREIEAGRGLDRDDAELLWQAIRRLKHADQQVIYLRYFLEVPEAEMASILEVPRGTVKSRLHRGLNRLREVVETEFPDLHTGLYA